MTPTASFDGRQVVVAGLLVDGRRVLLGHRQPGRAYYPDCWDVPGGHVEAGEEPAAALRRELAEELGVDVDEPRRPPEASLLSREVDFRLWEVRRWQGEPANRAPEEHDEVGWRTLAEAIVLRLAHPGLRRIVATALGARYWAGAVVHDTAGRVLLRPPSSDRADGVPLAVVGPAGPLPCWEVPSGSIDAAVLRHGLEGAVGVTVRVPGEVPLVVVEEGDRALAVWDVPWPAAGASAGSAAAPSGYATFETTGTSARGSSSVDLVWHDPAAARARLAEVPALLAVVDQATSAAVTDPADDPAEGPADMRP